MSSIFSPVPPIPQKAILGAFRDVLVRAAEPDRSEYWSVAERIYHALYQETKAQGMVEILAKQQCEDIDVVLFEVLDVVNALAEAAEVWWRCFEYDLPTVRYVASERGQDAEWVVPLLQVAQDHYTRVQALYWQTFQELVTFAQSCEVALRIPLEHTYAQQSLSQLRERQRAQAQN